MAEWQKTGCIEACEGTSGATGVFNGSFVSVILDGVWCGSCDSKAAFEAKHCQPAVPKYVRRDYGDGSVVLESVAKDENGLPLRSWQVWQDGTGSWRYFGASCGSKDEAIRMAIESADTEAEEQAEKSQPRHRLIECADGAVMVLSTDEVDGKPRLGAFVSAGKRVWVSFKGLNAKWYEDRDEAIAAAVAYVTVR
jgi:hypothetical protein